MYACDLVTKVYRGKKRKSGEARISHERDMFIIAFVYLNIRDVDLLIAIFLHDLYEDYPKEWPLYKLSKIFGYEVTKIVSAVTKPKLRGRKLVSLKFSQAVADKVSRGGKKAEILKCIDRFHNFLKPFDYKDRLKMIWKVHQTIGFIQPMCLNNGYLISELEIVVAGCIKTHKITTEEFVQLSQL